MAGELMPPLERLRDNEGPWYCGGPNGCYVVHVMYRQCPVTGRVGARPAPAGRPPLRAS